MSFTVETDGRLPSGQPLAEAIDEVDSETGGAAAYFMVNCAHPTHFLPVLDEPGPWGRILGIRANASTKSHAELDESEELDAGDPAELAAGYLEIGERLPHLTVLGGCCGTDHRHVASVADAWFARLPTRPDGSAGERLDDGDAHAGSAIDARRATSVLRQVRVPPLSP